MYDVATKRGKNNRRLRVVRPYYCRLTVILSENFESMLPTWSSFFPSQIISLQIVFNVVIQNAFLNL